MSDKEHQPSTFTTLFNIEEGEGPTVRFLFIHSLFLGALIAFYYTGSLTLFIEYFDRGVLPYAYIAAGALGYGVSYLYGALEKRKSFSQLSVLNLAFLLATITLFSLVARFVNLGGAVIFVIFIWFNLIKYLTSVAFWGLAGRFFNLRQAKRLFGLVSTGNVVSGLVGYISIPLLLDSGLIKVPDLLIICAGILAPWLVFMIVTVRKFEGVLAAKQPKKREGSAPADKAIGFFENRYTTLVFVLAILPIFVWYFVDFFFLGMTKEALPSPEAKAAFISYLFAFIKVVEFVFKTFVSGNLMNRYGIKASLGALPLMLALSVGLAAFIGILRIEFEVMTFSAVFVFIIFSKLFDRTLRTAVNEPAFQLLFQPIPAEQRFSFQSKIEGVPKQLGIGLVGITLIFLSMMEAVGDAYKLALLFLILVGWLALVGMMYRAYRRRVEQTLEEARATSERSLRSATTINVLKEKLRDLHHDKIVHSLRLLGNLEAASIEAFLIELLEHPQPHVRRGALQEIEHLGTLDVLDALDRLIATETVPAIRTAALETRRTFSEVRKSCASFECIAALAQSADPENRKYGALLLGQLSDQQAQELLGDLLQDADPMVRKTALVAAGKTKNPDFWPIIFEHLASPIYSSAATSTLVELGEPVLPALERFFNKMIEQPKVVQRIINIYGRIGGQQAGHLLWEQINFPDDYITFQVLPALKLCHYQVPEDRQVVLRQKINETAEDIAWSMASLRDLGIGEDTARLRAILESGIVQKRERLFLLLSLSYDEYAIDLVRDQFKEESEEARIFALELMDLFMTQETKAMVFPILEDTSVVRRLKRLEKYFPQQRLTRLERLREIINREYTKVDRWTKASALHTLFTLYDQQPHDELRANVFNPDPLLRETAVLGLHHIDPAVWRREIDKLEKKETRTLERITEQATSYHGPQPRLVLITEKINFLKRVDIFSELPEVILAASAPSFDEIALESGRTFICEGDMANELYIVVNGEVRVDVGSKTVARVGESAIIGEMAVLNEKPRMASVTTVGKTRLFRLKGEDFFELVFDHFKVTGTLVLLLNERMKVSESVAPVQASVAEAVP